jgi:hypothetical protein
MLGATCSKNRAVPPHFAAAAAELSLSHSSTPSVSLPASASVIAADTAAGGDRMSLTFLPSASDFSMPVAEAVLALHSSISPAGDAVITLL